MKQKLGYHRCGRQKKLAHLLKQTVAQTPPLLQQQPSKRLALADPNTPVGTTKPVSSTKTATSTKETADYTETTTSKQLIKQL